MYMDKIHYLQYIIRDARTGDRAMPREMEERARSMLESLVKDAKF